MILLACTNSALSCFNFIRHEKCQLYSFVVFESRVSFLLDILLVNCKELLMQYFSFIVDHNPKWLTSAIPSIIPLKIRH